MKVLTYHFSSKMSDLAHCAMVLNTQWFLQNINRLCKNQFKSKTEKIEKSSVLLRLSGFLNLKMFEGLLFGLPWEQTNTYSELYWLASAFWWIEEVYDVVDKFRFIEEKGRTSHHYASSPIYLCLLKNTFLRFLFFNITVLKKTSL